MGALPEKLGWGCVPPLPKTPNLKLKLFSFPIYDLTKRVPIYDRCGWHSALNILLRAFVDGLIDKDEKVISSKINIPNSRLDCKNHTLFDQYGQKTILFYYQNHNNVKLNLIKIMPDCKIILFASCRLDS